MAAAKRIAAKQSGTAQPQLSGRERAQAMAKARIAAKNAPAPQRVAQGQAPQAAPRGQDALNRNPGRAPQKQDALNRNPNRQRVGTPATASRKIDGAGLANTMRAQNSQSGGAVKTAQAPQSGNTSSSSSKTIGVDTSPGKSDTKSLVNPNKKKNVKNARKVTNQMNQLGKKEAQFTGEPAATTTVGKIDDF